MLRARTIREGSVGLLAVVGVVLFGAIVLWIRGIRFGERSYEIVAEFPHVNGIQVGDGVRYRGLRVGKIVDIRPGTNGVDVRLEISSSKLQIPKEATIQASSSGLIGETFIDIAPQKTLPPLEQEMNPLSSECDPKVIICDRDRLQGQPAITLDDLLPLMFRLSSLYSDPRFFDNVNSAAQNTSVAADELAQLSRRVSVLVEDVQQELASVSTAADALTKIADDTTSQITTTAAKYQQTADQINELVSNANELVTQNRGTLVNTLDNISQTSDRLQSLLTKLDTSLESTDTEQLVQNLETLTANAADASANFAEISETFSDSANITTIQQTLDSARVTFANAQKITADLEEITGDPDFRANFRRLIDGLSSLVSSTQQLEQQVQTTKILEPEVTELNLSFPTSESSSTAAGLQQTPSRHTPKFQIDPIPQKPILASPPIPDLNKQPKP